MENFKMGSNLLCLMGKSIHDSTVTVWNIYIPYLRDFRLKIWEIYKKCSNSLNFWARKMFFFFKWVRISPEIDWYHYQGASPAPTCIVRHQKLIKTPTRWSVTSEPSVPLPPLTCWCNTWTLPKLWYPMKGSWALTIGKRIKKLMKLKGFR